MIRRATWLSPSARGRRGSSWALVGFGTFWGLPKAACAHITCAHIICKVPHRHLFRPSGQSIYFRCMDANWSFGLSGVRDLPDWRSSRAATALMRVERLHENDGNRHHSMHVSRVLARMHDDMEQQQMLNPRIIWRDPGRSVIYPNPYSKPYKTPRP